MKLAVGRVLQQTTAEGPFRRTAIWVQGCSIRCPGCINPHLFESGGTTIETEALAHDIRSADVEGLTLLGGEPFDQAAASAELAEAVQAAGMGVIAFSGRTYSDLQVGPPDWQRLLEATDLLVDGPYVNGLPEQRRSLVGSTNQQFVHLSERYRRFDPSRHRNRLDVRVGPSGEARLAGFLTRGELRSMTSDLPGTPASSSRTEPQ